ncbi:MAG TPA: hypothetical protein VNV85_13665 [Puia sp.]|jgi:hypothetical protein|nr:hypothetical protein [Puia sp.]
MPLTVNTKHVIGKSIQDVYIELVNNSTNVVSREMGNNMLTFIKMLNGIFLNTQIWALTSHYHLVLQAKDDWKSDWLVKIHCLGNEYYIEYLMPEKKKPWPNAYVLGVAIGLDEAKKYLLIAMKECGGWEGNFELVNSLK